MPVATVPHKANPTSIDFFNLAVPQPAEPIFELAAAYERDANPEKVNVSIGAYRDETGKSWVLPAVRQVYHTNSYTFNAPSLTLSRLE